MKRELKNTQTFTALLKKKKKRKRKRKNSMAFTSDTKLASKFRLGWSWAYVHHTLNIQIQRLSIHHQGLQIKPKYLESKFHQRQELCVSRLPHPSLHLYWDLKKLQNVSRVNLIRTVNECLCHCWAHLFFSFSDSRSSTTYTSLVVYLCSHVWTIL